MTDHPIIFSAPMVRAILAGTKTMTRRLAHRMGNVSKKELKEAAKFGFVGVARPIILSSWCRISAGDRLWVRENWHAAHGEDRTKPHDMTPDYGIAYAATYSYAETGIIGKLRPSIYMPRWASRLTLTVTATKIEPVQNISAKDAIAEGIEFRDNCYGTWNVDGTMRCGGFPEPIEAFRCLWTNINGVEAWQRNPDVVALSFNVHVCNIDAAKVAA